MMRKRCLNLEKRRRLAKWLEPKIPIKEIADNLARALDDLSRDKAQFLPRRRVATVTDPTPCQTLDLEFSCSKSFSLLGCKLCELLF